MLFGSCQACRLWRGGRVLDAHVNLKAILAIAITEDDFDGDTSGHPGLKAMAVIINHPDAPHRLLYVAHRRLRAKGGDRVRADVFETQRGHAESYPSSS